MHADHKAWRDTKTWQKRPASPYFNKTGIEPLRTSHRDGISKKPDVGSNSAGLEAMGNLSMSKRREVRGTFVWSPLDMVLQGW